MNRKLKIRCQHDIEPFARKMLFAQHGDVYRDNHIYKPSYTI